MAKSLEQQIEDQMKSCTSALLVIPQEPSVDTIASVITLGNHLESLNKKVTMVGDGFKQQERLSFLHTIDLIQSNLKKQNNLKEIEVCLRVPA